MKHLQKFNQYNESKLTKYVAGAAIAGATLWGTNAIINSQNKNATTEYQETELAHFPEFYVRTLGFDNNLNVSVNDVDDIIGTRYKSGKYNRYTITVQEGQEGTIYYKISPFGEYIYATTIQNYLPNGNKIVLSELEVVEETGDYKILSVPSPWSGLDYILVNKGYFNAKNGFEMQDQSYTYFQKSLGLMNGSPYFVVRVN
jgi:hypothetical protein